MTDDPLAGMAVEVRATFDAPIDEVWGLLSDVERMAGLGPEHYEATWVTEGPTVGAEFVGWNRNGAMTWDVRCVVTACRPPEYFEWTVDQPPHQSSTWSYELRSTAGGPTEVVQRFRHGPGFSYVRLRVEEHRERAQAIIDGRSAMLRAGMEATLAAAAELLAGGADHTTAPAD
jgi:uncharacterized protein YndB with AHSA1/START domain